MSKYLLSTFKAHDNIIHIIEEESYNGTASKRIGISSSPKKRSVPKMTPFFSKESSIQSYQKQFDLRKFKPPKKAITDLGSVKIQRYYTRKEEKECEEVNSESDVSSFELDKN